MFCTQEKISVLIDDTINCISEFVLRTMDNESCNFKEILKQPDRTEFIKAMEKKRLTIMSSRTIVNYARDWNFMMG